MGTTAKLYEANISGTFINLLINILAMVMVKREGIILKPTKHKFEAKGVFNPACIRKGKYVHMFYRAWDKNNHSTIGYCKLEGPLKVVERMKKPLIVGEGSYEREVEDPRIVSLNGNYYLI